MHIGKKKTPLHIAMSETIHNICKSKKLIQIMNTLGLSMSYEEMEQVNYALTHKIIKQTGNGRVPVSTSVCSSNIIHGAMDNLDQNEDTNSSINGSHDTVMVIYQNKIKTEIEEMPNPITIWNILAKRKYCDWLLMQGRHFYKYTNH